MKIKSYKPMNMMDKSAKQNQSEGGPKMVEE